ncbi:MAG: hypothetical protein JST26_03935 [Bacteroidetes bacterium]|nr:hypothetical protein [Bacteroidota bacterium]
MKKIVIPSLLAAIMIVSCNKTKNNPEPAQTASPAPNSGSTTLASKMTGGGPKAYLMHMVLQGPAKGWCSGAAANCVTFEPDIVVTAAMKTALDEVSGNGNGSAVANVFLSSDFTNLNHDYLGDDLAGKLKSGKYYLAKSNDNGSLASFICGTTYPVTLENMEFAFQGGYMQ